jgi:hypothetical protein
MHRVLLQDLLTTARALVRVAPSDRQALCERIVEEADTAASYRAKTGLCHPVLGDGTLSAAARHHGLAPNRGLADLAFYSCLHLAIGGVLARAGEEQSGIIRSDRPIF